MRFLILTTSHGLVERDQLMTNELVGALQREGHDVDVLLLKWQEDVSGDARLMTGALGEDLLLVPPATMPRAPRIVQRVVKWSASPKKAARAYRRFLSDRSYDGVIAGTPAMLFEPVLAEVRKAGLRADGTSLLLIHDFFPIHHQEIGLVPRQARPVLQRIEERTMSTFDIIYCNLPSNIDYLRDNYRLSSDPLVSWTPLWTRVAPLTLEPRAAVRAKYDLPQDRPIAIFGGQLIEGRGIEDMLATADLAMQRQSDLMFLFVGAGRLAPLIDSHAARPGSNVRRIAQVSRDDYLNVVGACDVGMVATVPGVSSHSFPTKSMDYLRAGIPMAIAVEPGSSLSAMLTQAGVGLSVDFGDIDGFLRALETAVHDPAFRAPVGAAARAFLDNVLDVNLVPQKIATDMARVRATPRNISK